MRAAPEVMNLETVSLFVDLSLEKQVLGQMLQCRGVYDQYIAAGLRDDFLSQGAPLGVRRHRTRRGVWCGL
jgi:hypothetical protein